MERCDGSAVEFWRREYLWRAPHVYRENSLDQWTIFPVPVNRLMLTYYELHAAEHCNLNCYHCRNYSNLVSKPVMADLERHKRDVIRLTELF